MGSELCRLYEVDWDLGGQAGRTFEFHWCSLELLERNGIFLLALGRVSVVRRLRIADSLLMIVFSTPT